MPDALSKTATPAGDEASFCSAWASGQEWVLTLASKKSNAVRGSCTRTKVSALSEGLP